MALVPDMWRVEILHPMIVHFPIALLICGTIARVMGEFVEVDGRLSFLKPAGQLVILLGALMAWVAVFTGTLADGEVSRTLCDPTVKKTHEDFAWVTAIIFSAAIVVDLGAAYFKARGRLRTALTTIVLIALVAGCVVLGYVGHLGARLVYQQGAGVYHPSKECTEFEQPY